MHDVLSSETVVDSDHLTNKSISNVRRGKKPYQIADMLFSGNLIRQDEAAGLLQGKAILISTGSGDPSTAAWGKTKSAVYPRRHKVVARLSCEHREVAIKLTL